MGRYADVIVDVPVSRVDRPFQYSIPDNLAGRLSLGSRVLVPFGKRSVEGYVVGFSDEKEIDSLKSIKAVVDEVPIFTEELLNLARWMSERYLCLYVDALQCMLPTGIKHVSVRMIRLTDAEKASEFLNEAGAGSEKQKELVALLMERVGRMPFDEAKEIFGRGIYSIIGGLKDKNIIDVEESWEIPRIKPKKVKRLRKSDSDDTSGLTLKQLRLYKLFTEFGLNGIPPADLCKMAGVSRSVLDALLKRGLIACEDVEVMRSPEELCPIGNCEAPHPTDEQRRCIDLITERLKEKDPGVFLLHGVTGSGKTEVYLRILERVMEDGKNAIVLVPEISLTPQMVERFRTRFPNKLAILHSHLSLGERYDEWRRIRRGEARIVIGARSAIFAPLENIGIIIIDEEHETSYKQEDNPKYHARDVAEKRAELNGALLLLGSATPSVESYYKAESGRYRLAEIKSRVDSRPMPSVEIIDMREEIRSGNRSIFSRRLKEALADRIGRGEQSILFLNRRGHSTFILCRECGLVLKCENCDVSLTYHSYSSRLICHYCNSEHRVPNICPKCGSHNIRYFGIGTEKVEEELLKELPGIRVLRMDVDTTRKKGSHSRILSAFKDGEADVLIGTQMVAKGLDFPNVTLVGVISADTSLHFPDFRSSERTFQLLTQVAGRAGRGDIPGDVVVQTFMPEHYGIKCSMEHDYERFYREEIEIRRELGYPPFRSLIVLVVSSEFQKRAYEAAEKIRAILERGVKSGAQDRIDMEILGPAPAPLARIKGKYRWQLLLKGGDIALMLKLVGWLSKKLEEPLRRYPDLSLNITVDPMNLM